MKATKLGVVKNLRDLRAATNHLPDGTLLVFSTADHQFRFGEITIGTVLYDQNFITEDFGEKHTSEAEFGPRTLAVIIE